MDIARYLSNEAVLAAPPSTLYQTRKFVRRNWVMVTAASIAAAALLIGAIGFAWQARLARIERDAAIDAQARAESTMKFVLSILRSGDPTSGIGGDSVTVVQAMQAAINDLNSGRFSSDPETESQLWTAIADILHWYTRENEAVALYQNAFDAIRRKYSGDHPAVAVAMSRLAYFRYAQREYDIATKLAQDAVAMLERLGMDDTHEMMEALDVRLIVQPVEDGQRCVDEFRRMYEMQVRLRPGDNEDTIAKMWNLGNALIRQKQIKEGESFLIEALEMGRRLRPDGSVTVSHATSFLSASKRLEGDYAEAERLAHESLNMYRHFVEQETMESANKLRDLADVQLAMGKADEAEAVCTRALAYLRTREHPRTASVLGLRARCRQLLGRFLEAREDFDASLDLMRRIATDRDATTLAGLLYQSGMARLDLGEIVEAKSQLQEAYQVAQKAKPLDQQLIGEINDALLRCKLEGDK